MCRLCLLDRASLDWLLLEADADYITPWLEQLIHSNGGDGNGAAALFKYGHTETVKSLSLEPAAITEWFLDAYLAGAQQFLFHTRRASIGAISAENCHPFQIGKVTLAHNGHDDQMIADAKKLGYKDTGMPDSHAAAFLVGKKGHAALKAYSGTFFGWNRNSTFITLGKGSWPCWKLGVKKHGVMYCSEKPEHIKSSVYTAENLRPYVAPTWTYADYSAARYVWTPDGWIDTQEKKPRPVITRTLSFAALELSDEDKETVLAEIRERVVARERAMH